MPPRTRPAKPAPLRNGVGAGKYPSLSSRATIQPLTGNILVGHGQEIIRWHSGDCLPAVRSEAPTEDGADPWDRNGIGLCRGMRRRVYVWTYMQTCAQVLRMDLCIDMRIDTCVDMCTGMCTHMCIHMCTHMSTHMSSYTHVYVHVYTHIDIHMSTCTSMCMSIRMCIHMSAHMSIRMSTRMSIRVPICRLRKLCGPTHLSSEEGLVRAAEKESNRRCARFWHPLQPQLDELHVGAGQTIAPAGAQLRLRLRAPPSNEPGGTGFRHRLHGYHRSMRNYLTAPKQDNCCRFSVPRLAADMRIRVVDPHCCSASSPGFQVESPEFSPSPAFSPMLLPNGRT